MGQQKIQIWVGVLVLLGVLTRLVPHPANFTALAALALWSTSLFRSKTLAISVPWMTLLASDLILGFHSGMLWVYGAFLVISVLSLGLQPQLSWMRNTAGALVASLTFFAITNFGVWAEGTLYSMNFSGLIQCYAMGLPFLKNQIAGDLFYTCLMGVAVRSLVQRHRELTSPASAL